MVNSKHVQGVAPPVPQKKKGETNVGPRKASAVVGAVGGKSKEGPVIDVQGETPCAKRGTLLTLPQVEIAEKRTSKRRRPTRI